MEQNTGQQRGDREAPQKKPDTLEALITTIITEIQTTTKRSEETIRGGKRLIEIETSTLLRWQEKLSTAWNASRRASNNEIITKILANTQDIKKQLSNRPQPGVTSWSQVAATPPIPDLKPAQNVETRRKEVTVTVQSQEDKESVARKELRNLIAAIKTKEPKEATKEIIAARRLPSGDIRLSTLSEKARIELEKGHDWLRAVAPTAEIQRTTFPVFIHGVRVKGVSTNEQVRAIAAIRDENTQLHPGLEITRVSWPKRTIIEQKRYSSLILETASPETANRIITHGLIHEGEIKPCVRFLSEGRVTRCHKCQRYGNTARICRGRLTCAECAGEHSAETCTKGPEASRKCASCKGNHRSGSQQCEFERKERDRAAYARYHAQSHYQCTVTASPPITSAPLNAAAAPAPQAETQSQPASNGWQPVVKARRGRPTLLSQAAKDPTQTRIPSTQVGKRKERDFTSPTPPERFARSQSQPASEARNSNLYEALDSQSDIDIDNDLE
jgi:hypothetical protein